MEDTELELVKMEERINELEDLLKKMLDNGCIVGDYDDAVKRLLHERTDTK